MTYLRCGQSGKVSLGTLAGSVKHNSGAAKDNTKEWTQKCGFSFMNSQDDSRGRGVEPEEGFETLANDLSQAKLLANPLP